MNKIKFVTYTNVKAEPPKLDEWLKEDQAAQRATKERAKPTPNSEHVTVREAAELLRCSDKTVRRYVALGKLTATRADGGSSRLLIKRRSIELLLAAGTR